MSAPTWAKVLGLGALGLAGLGIASIVANGDDEEGGTIPPDDIEEDEGDDGDDDGLPVEPETVPEIFGAK